MIIIEHKGTFLYSYNSQEKNKMKCIPLRYNTGTEA